MVTEVQLFRLPVEEQLCLPVEKTNLRKKRIGDPLVRECPDENECR